MTEPARDSNASHFIVHFGKKVLEGIKAARAYEAVYDPETKRYLLYWGSAGVGQPSLALSDSLKSLRVLKDGLQINVAQVAQEAQLVNPHSRGVTVFRLDHKTVEGADVFIFKRTRANTGSVLGMIGTVPGGDPTVLTYQAVLGVQSKAGITPLKSADARESIYGQDVGSFYIQDDRWDSYSTKQGARFKITPQGKLVEPKAGAEYQLVRVQPYINPHSGNGMTAARLSLPKEGSDSLVIEPSKDHLGAQYFDVFLGNKLPGGVQPIHKFEGRHQSVSGKIKIYRNRMDPDDRVIYEYDPWTRTLHDHASGTEQKVTLYEKLFDPLDGDGLIERDFALHAVEFRMKCLKKR